MTDTPTVVARKKLIEVSLPLDAINAASSREKSIRHGHPSTLHLWWARRPLAAARAVLFAQLVDDPSARPELFPDEESQDRERQRLFGIIEELVRWENTTNEALLEDARREIRASWRRTCDDNRDHPRAAELFDPDRLPAFHDPFAGGGAIPLEAQRLGLEAHASDLNPVAVLINKAMIEIPPKFAGKAPVRPEAGPETRLAEREWRGAQGLAEDVRYYGRWMRDEAERRIGHLYPQVRATAAMAENRPDLAPYVGRDLTVIAWLWARTVKSPNPAFAGVDVPLASTFVLSKKKGKEAYVEPVTEGSGYRFTVKVGEPSDRAAKGTKSGGSHSTFVCLKSGTAMPFDHLRSEGRAGRLGSRLMAIVAEGDRGRLYLPALPEHEEAAELANPQWVPDVEISHWPGRTNVVEYGMTTFGDLFTDRQLVALNTFSDLVAEALERVRADAMAAGLPDDGVPLRDGGAGAAAYGEAVGVYLGMAVGRTSNSCCSLSRWQNTGDFVAGVFARQAIPMLWDFADTNVFSTSTQNWMAQIDWIAEATETLPVDPRHSHAVQGNAVSMVIGPPGNPVGGHRALLISTDPPYYDNVGYADLSDFFYVWLRRCLRPILPDLFSTLATPKAEELIATPYRHESKGEAERVLPRRHDGGDAPPRRPDASRLAGHDLLRLQAVGGQAQRRDGQHRLGDLPRRRDRRRLRGHRHLADAHRARRETSRHWRQRPRLQHRPRLPPAARGCARRHPPRVHGSAAGRTARGAASHAGGQHRAGRPGPGRHRAGHGGLHPLRPRPQRRRPSPSPSATPWR